jgi:hypothetical protein
VTNAIVGDDIHWSRDFTNMDKASRFGKYAVEFEKKDDEVWTPFVNAKEALNRHFRVGTSVQLTLAHGSWISLMSLVQVEMPTYGISERMVVYGKTIYRRPGFGVTLMLRSLSDELESLSK